jgi:hypothetical protein
MQTTVLAGEIANYAIYQLKNKVSQNQGNGSVRTRKCKRCYQECGSSYSERI